MLVNVVYNVSIFSLYGEAYKPLVPDGVSDDMEVILSVIIKLLQSHNLDASTDRYDILSVVEL